MKISLPRRREYLMQREMISRVTRSIVSLISLSHIESPKARIEAPRSKAAGNPLATHFRPIFTRLSRLYRPFPEYCDLGRKNGAWPLVLCSPCSPAGRDEHRHGGRHELDIHGGNPSGITIHLDRHRLYGLNPDSAPGQIANVGAL